MSNENANEITGKAFAIAALLGVAGFRYHLWTSGVSVPNLLVAFGMSLFVGAITAAGAVMAFRSKEQ
jgi:hypothetical protein